MAIRSPLPPAQDKDQARWAVKSLLGTAAKFKESGHPRQAERTLILAMHVLLDWRWREKHDVSAHCRMRKLQLLVADSHVPGPADANVSQLMRRILKANATMSDRDFNTLRNLVREYASELDEEVASSC